MKTNIVLVSLLERLNKKIATKLSDSLDMYLADVEDIIEYYLLHKESEIEEVCGADYLNKLKDKIVKEVSTYENTLITIPYSMFISKNYAEYFKKYCTVVFLQFPKNVLEDIKKKTKKEQTKKDMDVLFLTYDEHTAMCNDVADIVVSLNKSDFDFCYKKVEKVIDEYYL